MSGGTGNGSVRGDDTEISQLRAQIERLRQREGEIMALVGCTNPEKLLHDLRNVLNELQLLRVLAESDEG